MRLTLLIAVVLWMPSLAKAESRGSKPSVFELGSVYPDDGGVLFPSLAMAAALNPAALGNANKARVIQLAYGPPLRGGEAHRYTAAFATAKRSFGFGVGLDGAAYPGGVFQNGVFTGVGFNMERVSLGLSLRESDLSNGISPELDVGLIFGKGTGVHFGFALHGLERSPQADLGIGYSSGRRYNLELDVRLPAFSSLGTGFYRFSLGANLFLDPLTLLFRTSYTTGINTLSHTIGLGVWLNQRFNLGIQYSTPFDSATAGVTLSL
jgi:hypothetical protein